MIREKLGFFEFGDEALWSIKKFAEKSPEVLRSFSAKLFKLLKERNLFEYGQLMGLHFMMISNDLKMLKGDLPIPDIEEYLYEPDVVSSDYSDF